jgi:hypothetical protein
MLGLIQLIKYSSSKKNKQTNKIRRSLNYENKAQILHSIAIGNTGCFFPCLRDKSRPNAPSDALPALHRPLRVGDDGSYTNDRSDNNPYKVQ